MRRAAFSALVVLAAACGKSSSNSTAPPEPPLDLQVRASVGDGELASFSASYEISGHIGDDGVVRAVLGVDRLGDVDRVATTVAVSKGRSRASCSYMDDFMHTYDIRVTTVRTAWKVTVRDRSGKVSATKTFSAHFDACPAMTGGSSDERTIHAVPDDKLVRTWRARQVTVATSPP